MPPMLIGEGSRFTPLCVLPAGTWPRGLYCLPALGVSVRRYLPVAEALAARGNCGTRRPWRDAPFKPSQPRRQAWSGQPLLSGYHCPKSGGLRLAGPRIRLCGSCLRRSLIHGATMDPQIGYCCAHSGEFSTRPAKAKRLPGGRCRQCMLDPCPGLSGMTA